MKLIVCVDARGGMAFNGRRVSRDQAVCSRIMALGEGVLRMAPYSSSLFPGSVDIYVAEDFLLTAGKDDLCFLETVDAAPWLEQADKIILFCWNRTYPFDLQFPMTQLRADWQLVATQDFPGNSHERISMEVYEKCKKE